MRSNNSHPKIKGGAVLLALVLAVAVPFATPALSAGQRGTADATSGATVQAPLPQSGGQGPVFGGSTGPQSGKQMTVYESAIALYEQVEDAVLSDLVAAGIVTQADVDAYTARRARQKSLAQLDMTGWTARQYKAYYEANALTGSERKAAMQALFDSGQITQDQADALSANNEPDLWAKIMESAGTNPAVHKAISTMQQAQATLNSTLRGAGIGPAGNGKAAARPGTGGGWERDRDDGRDGGDEGGEDD